LLEPEKEIRLDEIKEKYHNYDDIVLFLEKLERTNILGNKRTALVQEKFPNMDKVDIVFLLFYPEGWQ